MMPPDVLNPPWARLLTEYPRFADSLVPNDGAVPTTYAELTGAKTLDRAVEASRSIFDLEKPRYAAQLWFYSLCNALVAPAVTAMVEYEHVASLDLSKGRLHRRDDYWYGFVTDTQTGTPREAGEEFADSIRVIIEQLPVRPAPLWAVAADCLAMAAVDAGNEAVDPYLGVRIACELVDGLASRASVPSPRFQDVVDGRIRETDVELALAGGEPDDDVHTVVHRASCCMILHSPNAGLCLSCPAQPPEERDAKLLGTSW